MKAKSKGKSINTGLSNVEASSKDLTDNIFVQQEALQKLKPAIMITKEDTLIRALQEVIDKVLSHAKLEEDDIDDVIRLICGRYMKDEWDFGYVINSEMFAKWFRKYVDVYKDSVMSKEELNSIAKL